MDHIVITSPLQLVDHIPEVKIDVGTFKYIQIKAYFTTSKKKIRFIRGSRFNEHHQEAFDDFLNEFHKDSAVENMLIKGKKTDIIPLSQAITFKCKGGGRIEHDATTKTITVYGYSKQYGRCKHKETVKLLKKAYPNYSKINWNNEGY